MAATSTELSTDIPPALAAVVGRLTLGQRAAIVWRAYRVTELLRRLLADENALKRGLTAGQVGWLQKAADGLEEVLP